MEYPEYPLDYPQQARARVRVALANAEAAFARAKQRLIESARDQEGLEKLVKQYIFDILFTFAFETAGMGKKGLWTADRIQTDVEEFGRRLIIAAECHKCPEELDEYSHIKRFQRSGFWDFKTEVWSEIETSHRWLEFLGEVAKAAELQVAPAVEAVHLDRSLLVDSFLSKCNQEPGLHRRVNRTHLWKAVGHGHPRQFQYWQAGEERRPGTTRGATREDDRNFQRVLSMKPVDFIALLRQKALL